MVHLAKDPVAECHGHSTRQSWKNGRSENHLLSAHQRALGKDFFLKKIQTLPSAGKRALGKEFFFKKIKNLCRVPAGLALGKATVNGAGAVTVVFLCRVPPELSAKPLPSAR